MRASPSSHTARVPITNKLPKPKDARHETSENGWVSTKNRSSAVNTAPARSTCSPVRHEGANRKLIITTLISVKAK